MAADAVRVFASSSCVRADSVIEAVRALAPITRDIELSGGTRYREGMLDELLAVKAELGLRLLVHCYFPPPREHFVLNFADTGERTRGFVAESVRYAAALGADMYTVHAGFKRTYSFEGESLVNPVGAQHTIEGIRENIGWFRSRWPGMGLGIENLYPNGGNAGCCYLMRPEEITSFLDMEQGAGLLLDLGHLKVSGTLLGFDYRDAAEVIMSRHAGRVMEIHVSENRGEVDDHEPLGPDSYQLTFLARHAAEIARRGIRVSLEARGHGLDDIERSLGLMRAALEK